MMDIEHALHSQHEHGDELPETANVSILTCTFPVSRSALLRN